MSDAHRSDHGAVAPMVLAAVAIAVIAVVAVAVLALAGGGGDDADTDDARTEVSDTGEAGDAAATDTPSVDGQADASADPAAIITDAAAAMADVTGAEFTVSRTGAPVFVDETELLQIDGAQGQFQAPSRLQARLDVTVNGTVQTELAAISIDEQLWLSNPLTGNFETLPGGFDIDLSRIFDPQDGWQPLLLNLEEVELVGIVDRGGERYHVRGVAPAAQVENFTVGLITGQDVPVDFWIEPGTSLVTAAELVATVIDGDATWAVELSNFGAEFDIRPPDLVGD